MLPFEVNFRPGEPVYEQVIYAVKKAVASGRLEPGARFPAVRTLSQELRINPNTAHKVVSALTAQGVLRVLPGIGSVVAPPAPGSGSDRAELLNTDIERLVVEAHQLGLTEDAILAAVRRHWRTLSK